MVAVGGGQAAMTSLYHLQFSGPVLMEEAWEAQRGVAWALAITQRWAEGLQERAVTPHFSPVWGTPSHQGGPQASGPKSKSCPSRPLVAAR